jgi:hypothetical protein
MADPIEHANHDNHHTAARPMKDDHARMFEPTPVSVRATLTTSDPETLRETFRLQRFLSQQMALGAQLSACDQIKDPAKSAQCHHDVHLAEARAKLQTATSRVVAADQNMVCAKFLLAKKAEGVVLDPTRANREKGCAYAKELGMQ